MGSPKPGHDEARTVAPIGRSWFSGNRFRRDTDPRPERLTHMHTDTIVALSSGALPSGVAVIRASGSKARSLLESLSGSVPEPRRASLRTFRDGDGAVIDRGIALFFDAPKTVTGEDVAEFHLHGGRAVVAAFLAAATRIEGVRSAEAGGFTRRAFENGRIDLTEAEGLADLLSAETEAQRRAAVTQAGGALRSVYEGWMERLTRARAMVEASFDFADEGDVGEDADAGVRTAIDRLITDMETHLASAARGEILRSGFKVAIVGAPNAGKSSLLNALAEREAAIVTDIPGTTRDVISVTLDLGGYPVILSDTAGIRETKDKVEEIGVAKARAAMRESDLILALEDPADAPGPISRLFSLMSMVKHPLGPMGLALPGHEDEKEARPTRAILTVRTKIDEMAGSPDDHRARAIEEGGYDFVTSVKTGEGLGDLTRRIAELAREAAGDPNETIPLRQRQRELIADALRILQSYRDEPEAPAEVAAETLRRASIRLGALTGQVGVEDLLDVIFSEFCIGK